MAKHHQRQTFADIVREVVDAPPPEDAERTAGIYADGTIVDPTGRSFTLTAEALDAERAQRLASDGAVIVWDDCGCGGYCGLEWFDADGVRALVASGPPEILHNKRKRGWISEYTAEDGAVLLLVEAAVRWG